MAEQFNIIIPILAALLTGGFLMIFIESQQVAGNVAERFHFVMNPFFRSFSNYVKFISFFKTYFNFKNIEDSDYAKKLKDNIEKVAGLGFRSIMSGQDYPADYFTAKELESICCTINDIWYRIDGKQDLIDAHLNFDSLYTEITCEHTKEYLETSSQKYINLYSISFLTMNIGNEKKRNSRYWQWPQLFLRCWRCFLSFCWVAIFQCGYTRCYA